MTKSIKMKGGDLMSFFQRGKDTIDSSQKTINEIHDKENIGS